MIRRCASLLVVAGLGFASTGAEGKHEGPPPPTLTLDALAVATGELPKHVRVVEGLFAVSPQARNWYEAPHPEDQATPAMREKIAADVWASYPRPKAKGHQSFVAEGGVPGTAFRFEYEADPGVIRSFLPAFLWGGSPDGTRPGTPSKKHPEEVIFHGRFLVILSFPRGDPAAEWFKDRLRKKFRIAARRHHAGNPELEQRLRKAHAADDADSGLKLLDEHASEVADQSFYWYLRGEFAHRKQDWKAAAEAYGKASTLDRSLEDPLEDRIRWACWDGLGSSLLFLRRLDDAVRQLSEAWRYAKEAKMDRKECSVSAYNLACAMALQRKHDAALAALKEAVEAEPSWREKARNDGDFAESRLRADFQAFLQ